MIATCAYCHSIISYDKEDIKPNGCPELGFEFYVICPECKHSITIGAFQPLTDSDFGFEKEYDTL